MPSQDIQEKTIVITGATSGIGFAAARELVGRGATVVGIGRSGARCQTAEDRIRAAHPQAKIQFLLADLALQSQVRGLATAIHEWVFSNGKSGIDVLINNAAMVTNRHTLTVDGIETQFAVNHLAPFLLTHQLLPLLQNAPAARVLTVSSNSHYKARIHWRDPMLRSGYNTLRAYRQSKLANVLFSAELNRRYAASTPLRAYAIDPGLVNTEIGLKGTYSYVRWIWNWRRKNGVSPEQGAETILHVATTPSLAEPQAVYWKKCRPAPPNPLALEEAEAARLWAFSEHLCGIGKRQI